MNFQYLNFQFLIVVLAIILPVHFVYSQVVINEIAWMGTDISYNDEWIELYNNTDSSVDLDGWFLKAADGAPEIKLTRTVLVNNFYLLERTNNDSVPGIAADQIYTGALKNSGENLQLYDHRGNLIDAVDCSTGWLAGDNSTKQTMERIRSLAPLDSKELSSLWQTSQNPGGTPKAENSIVMLTEPMETEPEPQPEPQPEPEPITFPTGIIINEILPSPEGPDAEEEWIELYNQNASTVDISFWQLVDAVGRTKSYALTQGTKIKAKGFLLLLRPETGITLNNDGDTVKLLHPDANIVEAITFAKAFRGQSYNRTQQDWQWSSILTPGAKNIIPAPPLARLPSKIQPTQTKTDNVRNTISATSADIAATAAISKAFEQAENKNNKPMLVIFIAAILALFSGAIVLVLKTALKSRKI